MVVEAQTPLVPQVDDSSGVPLPNADTTETNLPSYTVQIFRIKIFRISNYVFVLIILEYKRN